jgi:hypothetical protein
VIKSPIIKSTTSIFKHAFTTAEYFNISITHTYNYSNADADT